MKSIFSVFALSILFGCLYGQEVGSFLKIKGNISSEELNKYQKYGQNLQENMQKSLPINSKDNVVVITSKNYATPLPIVIFQETFYY